jgi:flagellar assembly factor FliW
MMVDMELPAAPQVPVVEMTHPLPGFPDEDRFALAQLDDQGRLFALRSLDATGGERGVEFVVAPPGPFHPDYAPEIGDDVVADLRLEDVADAMVLVVVRAGASLADSTVNLRAPIVINTASGRASQVILDDPELPLAAPLLAGAVR